MELINTVSMSGNLVITLIVGAVLTLAAIGGFAYGSAKALSPPKPPKKDVLK